MSAILHIASDGWRARLDEDATDENFVRIADAAAHLWTRGHPGAIVYVAFDARPEAERFACLVGRVLAGYGLVVKVSDRFTPAPALAWTVRRDNRACGGVMVTGSHAPYDYLGVKFYMEDGGIASQEFTRELEAEIDGEAHEERGPIGRKDIVTPYLDNLCQSVDGDAIASAHLHVVFDSLYGPARGYLPSVMGALGVDVVEIHGKDDEGQGEMHPEPVEPWVDDCEQAVVETGSQMGLVTDGDGTRVGAVDENGRFVSPRIITALVLKHLIENRGETGRVVLGISSSVLAQRVAERYGQRVSVRPIGFNHIYKEMKKGDVMLGAEDVGGIAVGSHMLERDALFISLLLCELVAVSGMSLEELVADLGCEYGSTSYAKRDVRVGAEVVDVFRTMLPGLNPEQVAGKKPETVSHLDGLRLGFADGSWLLLRPSRTKPLVRVYAEAPTVQMRDRLLAEGAELARRGGSTSGM